MLIHLIFSTSVSPSRAPLASMQEMYDLDLAQFDKIAVTLDKFKIGVEGASGVWVDAGTLEDSPWIRVGA